MRVIDVHHHWMPRQHLDDCERYLPPGYNVNFDGRVYHVSKGDVEVFVPDNVKYPSIEEKLKDMDEAGIDVAVVCTSIWQEWTTLEMGRFINDELAKACRAHPQRIAGLAHVPPMHPEAPAELERAVVELGMVGACITTNTQGKYPDDPAYYPFYAKAADLEAPVFVHAASTPVDYENLRPHDLARSLGRALDHTLVTTRVLYSGLMKEFPTLRFQMGHLGGMFFALRDRFVNGLGFLPLTDIDEFLSRIYYDTGPPVWNAYEIELAVTNLGIDQVCFGSDYPVREHWLKKARDIVDGAHLTADDRAKLMGGNALRLYPRLAKALDGSGQSQQQGAL